MVSWSPYHYTYNNPISFVDPDGRNPIRGLSLLNKARKDISRGRKAYKAVKSGQSFRSAAKSLFTDEIVPSALDAVAPGLSDVRDVVEMVTGKNVLKEVKDVVTKVGKRRKNRVPDIGEPNTVGKNAAGTTAKKYGPDGNVQKEFNKGHNPNQEPNPKGREDHIHDYKPNPKNPSGRGEKMDARTPKKNEALKDFGIKNGND